MSNRNTTEWLEHMRQEQDEAEERGDYVKVRDICNRVRDFGLENVYNRNG